jgi:hypothetical protein
MSYNAILPQNEIGSQALIEASVAPDVSSVVNGFAFDQDTGPARTIFALTSAPELDDVSPVALRWPAGGQYFEFPHRLPFDCGFLAEFMALLALAVERLSHSGGTACLAKQQHFHLKVSALIGHAQPIPNADFACRLGNLPVG